ncbi:uncharacterized protein LOC131206417 [Anopheles bellator]|uniref:uncharacterized protein LOC131206417 n=1 Tax=Anopheles bellator TaxID=139047 RepID=UPI0026485AC5|nr:uncharacterized protein LOC131206417 [Anopheles bellator]
MEERSSEDPEVRKAFSDGILHILRPLSSALDAASVRCDSGDSAGRRSAISEPFSDLDESYILLDQRAKQPGNDDDGDMMLLNQFTAEFREVYEQLLREHQEPEPEDEFGVGGDDAQDLLSPGATGDDWPAGLQTPEFQAFVEEMLQQCNLKYHLEEKRARHEQAGRGGRGRRVRKVQPIDPKDQLEPAERDSLSGVWCMLDAVSEPNGFPVTDGPYDLYEDPRFEWLLRENIPWQRLEASRQKCEQWLKVGPGAAKTDEKPTDRQRTVSGQRRGW